MVRYFFLAILVYVGFLAITIAQTSPPPAIVTRLEPSYVPDQFFFMVDQPVENCAAGTWLLYIGGVSYPSGGSDSKYHSNVRNMYNTLLTQRALASKITVYARPRDTQATQGNSAYCIVNNIHVM